MKETSRQLGVPINQEHVSLNLLCEVCPSVAVGQSRLAVQLLFGREDLVRYRYPRHRGVAIDPLHNSKHYIDTEVMCTFVCTKNSYMYRPMICHLWPL